MFLARAQFNLSLRVHPVDLEGVEPIKLDKVVLEDSLFELYSHSALPNELFMPCHKDILLIYDDFSSEKILAISEAWTNQFK